MQSEAFYGRLNAVAQELIAALSVFFVELSINQAKVFYILLQKD
jgi:hypothetical protein